jgi:tetratricopeptide (TPR) repeat protein
MAEQLRVFVSHASEDSAFCHTIVAALLPVTAGQIECDDFGTDNGWLAYYSYKRVEAHGFAPFTPDQAARRLLHSLGLTPRGEAPAPIAPQPTESADDLLTRARALIAQKKFAEALPLLERATQLAPGSFDARANLGLALMECGRDSEALTAFDRATALDGKQAWVWCNKGNALGQKMERYD